MNTFPHASRYLAGGACRELRLSLHDSGQQSRAWGIHFSIAIQRITCENSRREPVLPHFGSQEHPYGAGLGLTLLVHIFRVRRSRPISLSRNAGSAILSPANAVGRKEQHGRMIRHDRLKDALGAALLLNLAGYVQAGVTAAASDVQVCQRYGKSETTDRRSRCSNLKAYPQGLALAQLTPSDHISESEQTNKQNGVPPTNGAKQT